MALSAVTLQSVAPLKADQKRTLIGDVTGNLYVINPLGQVIVAAADVGYFLARGWAALEPGSGANVVVVDFGAFPGSNYATTTIPDSAAPDISLPLMALVLDVATVDHSADEHAVDGPVVSAVADGSGNVIINAYPNSNVPKTDVMMPWGKWTVAWSVFE